MSVSTNGERGCWAIVAGRKVRLYMVDPVSGLQSVRICTARNKPGVYLPGYYFGKPFRVTKDRIERFSDLNNLVRFLEKRHYRELKSLYDRAKLKRYVLQTT